MDSILCVNIIFTKPIANGFHNYVLAKPDILGVVIATSLFGSERGLLGPPLLPDTGGPLGVLVMISMNMARVGH